MSVDHQPTEATPIGAPTLRQSGRVLLFAVLYAATFVGVVVAVVLGTSVSLSGFGLVVVLGSGIGAAVGVAVWVHLLRRDGMVLGALGLTRPTSGLLHLLWQIPLIVICSAIVVAIVLSVLLQQEPPPGGAIDDVVASATWPMLIGVLLVTAVVTPLWEEVVFRGLLFSSLTRTLPGFVAALLSSAVFAAVHFVPLLMLYLFLIGLGCCWLYARHRSLWAPIALHAVNNSLVAGITVLT